MTLTRQQQEAVTRLDDNLCVVAGAGTGKTRVLVERFLHLMECGGCEPEQLAAITFTEKAAAEMLARLRDRCAERMVQAGSDDERARWKQRLDDLGDAAVTTIHGFCRRLLAQHPVEANLDPRFAILSDAQFRRLIADSVRAALREMFEAADIDVLAATRAYSLSTLQQMLRDALANRDAVARAAALCERPMREQLADLERHVDAACLEACDRLTADESLAPWRNMVSSMEGPEGDGREQSRELVAQALEMLDGRRPPEKRMEGLRALAAVGFRRRGSAGKWPSPEHYEKMGEALKALREAASEALSQCDVSPRETWPQQLETARAVVRVVGRAVEKFQNAKRQLAAVDFDDLLVMTRDLLRDHADVRRRIGSQFRQVLVDELQDTNPVQMEIVALLLGKDRPEAAMRAGSFFGVGDPKQSIYRFRGADVEVFRRVTAELGPKHTIPLTRTFRFHEGLAGATNTIFEPLLAEDFIALSANDSSTPPCSVELLLAEHDDDDDADTRRHLEAARMAARIRDLVRDEGVRHGDIAVLMHRQTQIYAYEEALKRLDIPYYVVSGRRFYDQDEVHDVLVALRALTHPHDDLTLAAVLRGPLVTLSDDGLYHLCGHKPLAGALADEKVLALLAETDRAKARRARAWLVHFTARAGRIGVARLLREIVFDGLAADGGREACPALAHVVLPQFMGRQRYANLRRLLEMARQAEQAGRSRLDDFLEEVEAGLDEGVREAEAPLDEEGSDSVLLMTVHRAKGLEFPYVILANADAERRGGGGPSFFVHPSLGFAPRRPDRQLNEHEPAAYTLARREDRRQEDAEFRRLFYVAATRARQRLIISGSQKIGEGSWLAMTLEATGDKAASLTAGRDSRELAPGATMIVDLGTAPAAGSPGPRSGGKLDDLMRDGELDDAKLNRLLAKSADMKLTTKLGARCGPVAEGGATLHLTATSLVDYSECPAMYYLKHVLGLSEESLAPAAHAGGLSGAAIGTVVHGCLERMDARTLAVDDDVVERLVRQEPRLRGDQREEAMAAVRSHLEAFRDLEVSQQIATAAACGEDNVRREVHFAMAYSGVEEAGCRGVVISGTIDLLVRNSDGAWTLVDYKTDRIGAKDARKRTMHHLPQLQIYRAAAGKFLKINVLRTCVAFLGAGIVEDIEDASVHTVVEPLVRGIARQRFERRDDCSRQCAYAQFCGRML